MKTTLICKGAVGLLFLFPTHLFAAPDLPNLHPVAPGIWRGAAPTEAGLRHLKAMGIKTVIDLRIAPKTVKREGIYARHVKSPRSYRRSNSRRRSRCLFTVSTGRTEPGVCWESTA
jgi:hypothetical protein